MSYSSPIIIGVIKSRRTRWKGHVTHEAEVHTKFWMGNTEGKRTLQKTYAQMGGYKVDLKHTGCEGMNWTDLAHDRDQWWGLPNAVLILWVPLNAGNLNS